MKNESFWDKLLELNILVIGDLMLDKYIYGQVERISPEAPVPILNVLREENRAGGAANVAMNLLALGIKTTICGVIGKDFQGLGLIELLIKQGFNTETILPITNRITTTKTRIIAQHQQMLRIDNETTTPLQPTESIEFAKKIIMALETKPDAIILEDYDKGLLNKELIQTLVKEANRLNIPAFVDPKFKHFFDYEDVTVFKPNLKELKQALNLSFSNTDMLAIQDAIEQLRKKMPHKITLVTMNQNGVLVCAENEEFTHIPAHIRKIVDVSGAGDTVIAVMAAGLVSKLTVVQATALANLAGGLVCEKVGVVPIDKAELMIEAKNEQLF